MADPARINSPLSSSPGRASSLSRAVWAWSPSQRNSGPSTHTMSSGTGTPTWENRPPNTTHLNGSGSWSTSNNVNQGSSSRQPAGSMNFAQNIPGQSTKQWTFNAFEWVVRDVHALRDYLESGGPTGDEPEHANQHAAHDQDLKFEILKESPLVGDGKFKLEIAKARTEPTEDGQDSEKSQSLSIYITSLNVDFTPSDFEMACTMMAAIKCQDDRAGERGARPDWVWEFWQNDWTFREESEVWPCPLPRISSLLDNARIRETDSFVICVQIHCPVGPFFPQQPSSFFVPRDLLEGLEASLDNQNTGDVRFICLEKLEPVEASPSTEDGVSSQTRRPSSALSHSVFSSQKTARKRVIYAHSDILVRRSEYFATMLTSSFSENSSVSLGDRKIFTVVVEEADFETIYWLLKWVYANWLLFRELDDPRQAVDGVGAGWSTKWLSSSGGEWDWKTFDRSGSEGSVAGDSKSVTSGESIASGGDVGNVGKLESFEAATTPTPSSSRPANARPPAPKSTLSTSAAAGISNSPRHVSVNAPRRPAVPSGSSLTMSMASSPRATKPGPMSLSTSNSTYTQASHYPISPRQSRTHGASPDPHPHPAPPPRPASALSMYQVAHRYAMPGLAALALEHMMSTLTPQSSFALLLATSAWEELRALVEDFVVDKWDEVSVSEEFEHACQEVAAGEWGPEGGKTLTALFRRLRSPTGPAYIRT